MASRTATSVSYEEVTVSPQLAKEWLDRTVEQGKTNRKLSNVTVSAYQRDMEEDRWKFNAVPIIFDENDLLADGQHRLWAVIRSGLPQQFLVARGVPAENRRTIDIGRKRSVADNLVMDFGVHNSSQVASASRMIIKWQNGKLRASNSYKITDAEITAFVLDNNDLLQESASYAQKLRRAIPISLTSATAAHHETSRVDPRKAEVFWTQAVTGAGLQIGDPALSFRNAIVRIGSKHEDRSLLNLELAVRAWRYHVAERKTGQNFLRKSLGQIRERDFLIEDHDFDVEDES